MILGHSLAYWAFMLSHFSAPGSVSGLIASTGHSGSDEHLRRQLLQQPLRLVQITRLEAFREPPVNGSQQFASLLRLALVTPEACEAHCRAQLKQPSALCLCDLQCLAETLFDIVGLCGPIKQLTPNSIYLE